MDPLTEMFCFTSLSLLDSSIYRNAGHRKQSKKQRPLQGTPFLYIIIYLRKINKTSNRLPFADVHSTRYKCESLRDTDGLNYRSPRQRPLP